MKKQIIKIVKIMESNKLLRKFLPFLKKIKNVLLKVKNYFKNIKIIFKKRKTDKILYKILKEKGLIKLNLGCCDNKLYDWINVDINKSLKPDITANVIDMQCFRDNSVDSIKSAHLLEHLIGEDAIKALHSWFRILKSGGTLSIECPNLAKCIKMIYSRDKEEIRLGFIGIYGDPPQIRQNAFHHAHKHGWDVKMLSEQLKTIGFIDIQEVEIEETYRCRNQKYDRDMRIIAKKP